MSIYQAYQRQQTLGWTRVEMLLALFDRAILRLEESLAALREGKDARPQLAQCQMVVAGLATGVHPGFGEMAKNFQRLYEFVLYSLNDGRVDKLEGALRVMNTMRDGFRETRAEAVRLERTGEIPPVDSSTALQALA